MSDTGVQDERARHSGPGGSRTLPWTSGIARIAILVLIAGAVSWLQYFATAPFGVGGPVFVLVTVELVMLAVAGVLGFWAMRGVETAVERRTSPTHDVARFLGPGVCGLFALIAYLAITYGYGPPIVFAVTAIGVAYGILVSLTMWLTSPVFGAR